MSDIEGMVPTRENKYYH